MIFDSFLPCLKKINKLALRLQSYSKSIASQVIYI